MAIDLNFGGTQQQGGLNNQLFNNQLTAGIGAQPGAVGAPGGFNLSGLQSLQAPAPQGAFNIGTPTGAFDPNTAGFTPDTAPGGTPGGFFSRWMGGNQQAGQPAAGGAAGGFNWGGAAQGINAVAGLGNVWLGMKGLDQAKDSFNFQRDAFNKNFANQVQTTNTQLEDRQARRASGSSTATPVEEYMAKHAVKA